MHPHTNTATSSIHSQPDTVHWVIDFTPFYYSFELFGMLLL